MYNYEMNICRNTYLATIDLLCVARENYIRYI